MLCPACAPGRVGRPVTELKEGARTERGRKPFLFYLHRALV